METDPFFTEEIKASLPLPADCTNIVVGRGSKTPKVVLVGEAPGSSEDQQGIPFVGASGKLLDKIVEYWGLKTGDYAILNTVKWFPQDSEGKARPPTELEKAKCRPYLAKQIAALNPKLLVAVGATAATELCVLTQKHTECVGKIFPAKDEYGKRPVFVMFHPAYYLRNGKTKLDDLTKPSAADRSIIRGLQYVCQYNNNERLLVLDIETNASTDTKIAKLRYAGFYSDMTKEMGMTCDLNEIQRLVDIHTHVIGFNNREFDKTILERYNIRFNNKVIVDLMRGLQARGRKGVMGLDKLPDDKLETILNFLQIGKKLTFDYNLLVPDPPYSDDTIQKLQTYLFGDIEGTWKLYKWWLNWAEPYKHFVSEENQWRKSYMTCSVASFAYKSVCHAAGLPEAYNDEEEEFLVKTKDPKDILDYFAINGKVSPKIAESIKRFFTNKTKRLKINDEEDNLFSLLKKDDAVCLYDEFEGGFVSADVESAKGSIVCLDFKSLYPSVEIQGNLFSPITDDYKGPIFEKNAFYPELPGQFKADHRGLIETTVMNIWKERQVFKERKDAREYAHKITMNSLYGASTCRNFKSIYNPFVGPATTYMGRTNIKYVRKRFADEGFIVIYSDTDSAFIQISEGKTVDDVKQLSKQIAMEIQANVPFPFDEFTLALESRIKYFQAFRGKNGQLLKKFYMYVKEDNIVVIKGLPLIKSNATNLSKKIYSKYIEPSVITNLDCFFDEKQILEMIKTEYDLDHSVVAKVFKVKEPHKYASLTQLDCQIAATYGPGKHLMVPNLRKGLGKSVRYCTVEEAKDFKFEDIDFSMSIDELSFFMRNRDDVLKRAKKKNFIDENQTRLSEFL